MQLLYKNVPFVAGIPMMINLLKDSFQLAVLIINQHLNILSLLQIDKLAPWQYGNKSNEVRNDRTI